MKYRDIHEKGCYKGADESVRRVTYVQDARVLWVFLCSKTGYERKGEGACSLKSFASWARSKVRDPFVDFTCPWCGGETSYNEEYDASFCSTCDLWLSTKCTGTGHRECGFDCQNRPDKPSQVK